MLLILLLLVFALWVCYSWISMVVDLKRMSRRTDVPLPIVGHGLSFVGAPSRLLGTLKYFTDKYGSGVVIYIMSERYMLLTDPKHIEPIIATTEYNTKGMVYNYLMPWLGLGLLTSTGNRWKTHRKFLTPAFHFNILQNFLPVFCKNTDILTKKLAKMADGNTKFDLFRYIALAALDNVNESIMGVSMNAQGDSESDYVKSIDELCKLISKRIRTPFLNNDQVFSLLSYQSIQDRYLNILHGQTKKVIKKRREELQRLNITDLKAVNDLGIKNKHAFLDLLLLSEIDGKRISDEEIQEEVDTFMFEGHDTVTTAIVFTLYQLAKRNDLQDKILQEQRSIFGEDMDRWPTYNELRDMKYLECVIKEGLRMYPSVPIFARQNNSDAVKGDLFIPKDTTIIIDALHMQRRADIYEDPLVFNPDRFAENREGTHPFSWIPFSAGPRNCIGQKFAMMELKVTIAKMVKTFKLIPSDEEPILCGDIILKAENGVKIKVLPRN